MSKDELPRIDVPEVLRSYSRKLLREYEEGTKQLPRQAFDRGPGREQAVREFLGRRLPKRYGVGEGIVVDAYGGQSKQCDAVVYDRDTMLELSTEQSLTFWPIEGVYGVAQVKSSLTKKELTNAVENIASCKRLKRAVNDCIGGNGMYSVVGEQNPPFGMLVAHDVGDVDPGSDAFDEIIASVPSREQIDLFCVISGYTGVRGVAKPEGIKIIGLFIDEPTGILTWHYKDGALAAFLLLATQILNSIRLGEIGWFPYLHQLQDDIDSK